MAKVRFNLEKPKSKENTLIRLIYRYNGKKLVYTTKYSIHPKHWNETEGEVRKSYKDHKAMNDYLEYIASTTVATYSKLIIENSKLDNNQFRKALDNTLNRVTVVVEKKTTFLELFEQVIKNVPTKYAPSTLQSFSSAYKLILEYKTARKLKSMNFDDFTFEWNDDFKAFMFDKRMSDNYYGTILKKIKQVLQEGYKRRLHTNLEFKDFKGLSKEPVFIHLTETELKQLFEYDFSENKTYERARDLFLIGCYSGLRHSDFSTIKPTDFYLETDPATGEVVKTLKVYTQKTKQIIDLPIVHFMIKTILSRYNGNAPEGMTGQRMNIYLKELCKIAGIDSIATEITYKAGEPIEKTAPKYTFVCTHTARRSFSTNGMASGIDSQILRAATGHKTDKSFSRYNKQTDNDKLKNLAKTDFMTGKKINVE